MQTDLMPITATAGWLYRPEFPDTWRKYKLHDLASWINGMAFRDFHFTDSGRPIIKIAEIKNGVSGQTKFTSREYDSVYLVNPGDLLFSWSGQPESSIDAFWWSGPEGWLNQHIFRVIPTTDLISSDFLFYILRYLKPNFIGIAKNKQTTGLGHVTKADLRKIEVGVPREGTQSGIVRLLKPLDDKIRLNAQANETLEQLAQAIFQRWFVDFLPVRAKVVARSEGRDPLRAAMCALSGNDEAALDAMPREQYEQLAATAALFPDELVDSESGEIPLGWSFGLLADMCVLNAKSWGTKTLPDVVHYVDLTSTYNGEILDVQTFTRDAVPSRARRVLRAGDVIVGTVRPANRSFALIGELEHPLTGSTGFAVLSPRSPEVREFVYLAATSERNIERLHRLADGGAYPAVRPEEVVHERVVLPPSEVLAAFHQIACPMFERMLLNRKSNKTLGALRDTLLPRLLSGELQIPGAR